MRYAYASITFACAGAFDVSEGYLGRLRGRCHVTEAIAEPRKGWSMRAMVWSMRSGRTAFC